MHDQNENAYANSCLSLYLSIHLGVANYITNILREEQVTQVSLIGGVLGAM